MIGGLKLKSEALRDKQKQLIHRLFLHILEFMLVVSVFNIIGNVLYGFPKEINIKWIIFIGVILATYYFTKERLVMSWKFIFFAFAIFVMMPFSFIDSGGSVNNTIGYLFIIIICVSFFFWGWQRYFLVISTVIIFNLLLMIETNMPEVIKVYSDETQLLDRMVQISLLLILAFLFLKTFSDAYLKDKKRLDEIVHFDSLTGLHNRRSFDEIVGEMIKSMNPEHDFLVFIDIDHFKQINDSKGHHYGDLMIQSTAKLLDEIFGERDVVARWGGDEFAVLFHGEEKELIDKLNEIINVNKVALSCGYTQISNEISAEILLQRADKALYKSKEKGRNQWNKSSE